MVSLTVAENHPGKACRLAGSAADGVSVHSGEEQAGTVAESGKESALRRPDHNSGRVWRLGNHNCRDL